MVCSAPLQYHTRAVEGTCHFCGQKDQWYISCPEGHFICDTCHNQETMQQIEAIIFQTTSTDPFAIAEQCMDLDVLPMLGCQHTYIAGGALMAALKNEGTLQLSDDDIREVFHRTRKQAHGGYCGLTGTCGIAPALGACMAILTGSKCGTDKEQRLTMELVSRVVRAITKLTGPSCCKAYVRTSLEVAVDFFEHNLSTSLPGTDGASCQHKAKHPHGCRQEKCPFYPAELLDKEKRRPVVKNNLEQYKLFFDAVYEEGALDSKTKNLITLGASLAAGCEP